MRARGFTLVETMIALVVLLVGLLAAATMSFTFVRANVFSHQKAESTAFAQEKMEQLRSYANSDRADRFSVFDFDYLVSTDPAFTTVEDPPGSGTSLTVSGLLSGSNSGVARTTTGGTTYEVLTSQSCPAQAPSAADLCYSGQDTLYTATTRTTGAGFTVTRTWWVQPITLRSAVNHAWIAVDTKFTDRAGDHTVHLESAVHRRQ